DDDAVGLAALERAANAVRLLLVERAGLDAVPGTLLTEIDLGRLHAEVREHVAVRGLQLGPGRLGNLLALGRGELHAPAAGRARHVLDQAGDARAALAGRRRGAGRLGHGRRVGRRRR